MAKIIRKTQPVARFWIYHNLLANISIYTIQQISFKDIYNNSHENYTFRKTSLANIISLVWLLSFKYDSSLITKTFQDF